MHLKSKSDIFGRKNSNLQRTLPLKRPSLKTNLLMHSWYSPYMKLQVVCNSLFFENPWKQASKSHKQRCLRMERFAYLVDQLTGADALSHSIALNPVVHFSTCALVIAALLQWTSLQLLNYNELNVKQLFTSLKSNLVPNTCYSGLPLPIWPIINSILTFLLWKLKEP